MSPTVNDLGNYYIEKGQGRNNYWRGTVQGKSLWQTDRTIILLIEFTDLEKTYDWIHVKSRETLKWCRSYIWCTEAWSERVIFATLTTS